MALYVYKFGGTSVGSVERIKAVAEKVKKAHGAGIAHGQSYLRTSVRGESSESGMDSKHRVHLRINRRRAAMFSNNDICLALRFYRCL